MCPTSAPPIKQQSYDRGGGSRQSYAIPVPKTNSSLACCFEHSRFERLVRSRAVTGRKFKGRVVALACVERSRQQHIALSRRRVHAMGKHEADSRQRPASEPPSHEPET